MYAKLNCFSSGTLKFTAACLQGSQPLPWEGLSAFMTKVLLFRKLVACCSVSRAVWRYSRCWQLIYLPWTASTSTSWWCHSWRRHAISQVLRAAKETKAEAMLLHGSGLFRGGVQTGSLQMCCTKGVTKLMKGIQTEPSWTELTFCQSWTPKDWHVVLCIIKWSWK